MSTLCIQQHLYVLSLLLQILFDNMIEYSLLCLLSAFKGLLINQLTSKRYKLEVKYLIPIQVEFLAYRFHHKLLQVPAEQQQTVFVR